MHEHCSHLSLLDRRQGKSLEWFILKSPSLKWVMAPSRRCAWGMAAAPAEWKELSCELRWLTCPGRTIRRWNCSACVSECRAGERAGSLGNSSGINSFTLRKMYSDIAPHWLSSRERLTYIRKKREKTSTTTNFGAIFVSSAKFAAWGCCPAAQLPFCLGPKKKKRLLEMTKSFPFRKDSS